MVYFWSFLPHFTHLFVALSQTRTTPFCGVVLLLFQSADSESRHDLRRRSWVSKSKRPGGAFGRREVPQSKEFSEPRLPRRKKTTMRPGRAMKNPTSATKDLLGRMFEEVSLFTLHFSLLRPRRFVASYQ